MDKQIQQKREEYLAGIDRYLSATDESVKRFEAAKNRIADQELSDLVRQKKGIN